ncbi:hypothetical protein OG943_34100 [Amycolatopsis sp. NBC_00345]|uniref:hypothetical protein n=1 Tax=Amycolatopsis sp. NBC_00345 TaxID=2975955 RepID=UPI002E268576
MDITFEHDPRGECFARIRRRDGLVLGLPSFSRKFRVPHDLAHAVTERALGLGGGVFGCIAAGAVFGNMRVLEGKPRHDAKARSERVLKAAKRSIGVAECLSGVLHEAVEHGRQLRFSVARETWGILEQDPFPYSEREIRSASEKLHELAEVWQTSGEPLEFSWPERLRPA